jgi:hypothetical protein
MRIAILTFCTCLLLVSCKRKQHPEYEQKILGEWKLASKEYRQTGSKYELLSPPPIFGVMPYSGISFFPKNVFENKSGYFIDDIKSRYRFLGTTSRYKLNDDSVHFLDPSINKWKGFKIVKVTADSLLLEDQTYSSLKYIRAHYIADTTFKYDQIAISFYSSWGFGKCLLINDVGSIISSAPDTASKEMGARVWSQTKIHSQKLAELKNEFAIAGISNLKNEYSSGGFDGSETCITFIKDGKMIKSIYDNMYGAPQELIWAYTHLQYIEQSAKQCTQGIVGFPLNSFFISFATKSRTVSLSASETFYLCTLIRASKETTHSFFKKFDLKFYSDPIYKIQTDGQYYEVLFKNGTKKTYDIGFNFIERNASVLKFTDKIKSN